MLGAFAAIALLSIAPGSALASATDWARLRLPATLRAGDPVTLEIGAPPAGVEELEILLSVDGGRTFPVRVSREMVPTERRVTWRVANLPAISARMRVRYRVDGREVEGPPSAPFAIQGQPGCAQELDVFHEGLWWEGFDAGVGGDASLLGSGGPPRLGVRADAHDAVIPSSASVPAPPPAGPAVAERPAAPPRLARLSSSRPETFRPLRN